jgi:hydrogenase maturation protein HypF
VVEGRRIEVLGTVQGVGFRPWIHRLATSIGVDGRVRNGSSGVVLEVFGSTDALDRLLERMTSEAPPVARIRSMTWEEIAPEAVLGFSIEVSARDGERRASIPPDLATCGDCLREIFDRNDRRFGYAFTNCTSCGPRFSIVREVPYDRASTTMAGFTMCAECRREYDDIGDRRYHAEPNACPACGPQLQLVDAYGRAFTRGDPIVFVAEALRRGSIVAIKGIGGFHLACDAGNEDAVRELRRRKRRDEKPFAVMVADLERAGELAKVGRIERAILESIERPIVLIEGRAVLAAGVAPGCARLGLMLPYTPLHHLLMRAVDRPVVMTSANVSDEPIVYRNEEALARLCGITDLFLLHDREIENRCDDSVVEVVAGGPLPIRRARGFVPRSIELSRKIDRPVLGCGALLKNTFCIAHGDSAYLGPHVGDLDNLDVYEDYVRSIDRLERFLDLEPEIIAHDLHPDYLSTHYALSRTGATPIGVQHHHAHVVAAMAEHGLEGPVLGVAYDGTGFGTDGTSWGGEILLAHRDRFERLATFRPLALPGGDRAIREPWRIALSMVLDAFGADAPIERLPIFDARALFAVGRMLDQHLNTPLARGVGRWFDAVAALVLNRPSSAFEGQLAMALEQCAGHEPGHAYAYAIEEGSPLTVDLRPMVRELVRDRIDERPSPLMAARFHQTIARATADALVRAFAAHPHPVVLTGGCFQNARLTESLIAELGGEVSVRVHRRVPAGDGGIALGQALAAAAIAEKRGL